MRPAADILLLEAEALRPIVERLTPEEFDLPTVCDGWSVRDVLSHCGAALTRTAVGDLHRFTPAENEADVQLRRSWSIGDVLEELFEGYGSAAAAIDRADGALDAIGLGEWMHGGDVREAVGVDGAYVGAGVGQAIGLLLERSRRMECPRVQVELEGKRIPFGKGSEPVGTLTTDSETFVRLCGGRRPDPRRFALTGIEPQDLVLFS